MISMQMKTAATYSSTVRIRICNMSVITVASRVIMQLFYSSDCNEIWYIEKKFKPIIVLASGRNSALMQLRMLIIAEDIKQSRYILNIKE